MGENFTRICTSSIGTAPFLGEVFEKDPIWGIRRSKVALEFIIVKEKKSLDEFSPRIGLYRKQRAGSRGRRGCRLEAGDRR